MKKPIIYICCIILISVYACASSNPSNNTTPTGAGNTSSSRPQTQYTSSFPNKDVSSQLVEIQESILRYTTTGFYDLFFYNRNITINELQKSGYTSMASRRTSIDESKAGTAIALFKNNRHTVMITANHVLTFPDTIVVYKEGPDIPKKKFVESVAIKKDQRNYIYGERGILSIDIVGQNEIRDLAIISITTSDNELFGKPLNIRLGQAINLQTGSFLYVLGHPLGSPMVTRGIVSAPNFDGRGRFLTDALFNHGISGGLIIATRDNFNSFEWVGMALTASASEKQFLIPDPSKKDMYENYEAYTDTAYISKQRLINYGVTQAMPIEQIFPFLLRHEDALNKLGFSVTDMTKRYQ